MNDNISHPSHYCYGRTFEPKDVIRDWDLNFNLGSAVKYISRAGRKGDALEDLKKARQFLDFEIEALGGKEEEKVSWEGWKSDGVCHYCDADDTEVEENTEGKRDSACCHCESSYSKYGADIKTMSWEDASIVSTNIGYAKRYEDTKRPDLTPQQLIYILDNERNTLADERGEDYSGVTAMDYAINVLCNQEIARRCGH